MRTRFFSLFLLFLALALIILALGYSYLDLKDVSGTVHDPDGHPIAGAALTLAGHSTLSDETGHFELVMPRGRFVLTVFADGFAGVQQTITEDDLFEKNISADVTLPLNEFTGTVMATDVQHPLAGAQVVAGAGAALTTDARGMFTLRGLKRETKLEISAPGYRTASFIYEPDGTKEFVLTPALTHITITDAYTQLPLPGVTVTAGNQSAQTDVQGQVSLNALAADVMIMAQAPGHTSAQVQFKGEAQVALTLRPTIVGGTVTDAATKKPLANALIFYNGQTYKTNAQGTYQLTDVPTAITLTVKLPGYHLTSVQAQNTSQLNLALQPFKAKGIHIYYAMPRDDVVALLNRLRGTEVNAVVLDVKEGAGDIVWPSKVPLAQQIGAYHERGIAPSELIQICRAQHLYCIARMVIFKDTRLGTAHPEWALHYPSGGVFNAGNEIWMNPAKTQVWDYEIALAKELGQMGFDEVQFDYIRYPGNPVPLEFGTTDSRLETIRKFLETASTAFKSLPMFFSGDVFGLTTATTDEQGIGQRLEIDAPYFDYVSPMMYPSTWKGSPGLFRDGLNNPTCTAALACPYDIMFHGTQTAMKRTGGALIRPWLQAYTDSGFGVPQYIQQKQGSDDAGSAGWLFWNNQGIYPDAMFAKAKAQ